LEGVDVAVGEDVVHDQQVGLIGPADVFEQAEGLLGGVAGHAEIYHRHPDADELFVQLGLKLLGIGQTVGLAPAVDAGVAGDEDAPLIGGLLVCGQELCA
jgi:hypothetical protein